MPTDAFGWIVFAIEAGAWAVIGTVVVGGVGLVLGWLLTRQREGNDLR